jgi:hypothetical protein
MDSKSTLISSDVATGVVNLVMNRLQSSGNNTSAAMVKPFVEGVLFSIVGRMGQSSLSGANFSSKSSDGKAGEPYIKAEGRSSLIIAVSSYVYYYFMKSKNPWSQTIQQVASDSLGSEIISSTMATDKVWVGSYST